MGTKVDHNPTQNQMVLDYIQRFGSITPLEAMRDLGVMRLASRISDMRSMGYPIETDFVKVRNRFGKKTRVARYRLSNKQEVIA